MSSDPKENKLHIKIKQGKKFVELLNALNYLIRDCKFTFTKEALKICELTEYKDILIDVSFDSFHSYCNYKENGEDELVIRVELTSFQESLKKN